MKFTNPIIFASILSTLLSQSCSEPVFPEACFDQNRTIINAGDGPAFNSDCSKNATRFEWDFGDGNQSTIANPTHRFTHNGIFTVKLRAYNDDGFDEAQGTIAVGDRVYKSLEVKRIDWKPFADQTDPSTFGLKFVVRNSNRLAIDEKWFTDLTKDDLPFKPTLNLLMNGATAEVQVMNSRDQRLYDVNTKTPEGGIIDGQIELKDPKGKYDTEILVNYSVK